MINNETKVVQLLTFTSDLDDYGQPRQGTPSSADIEMYVKVFSQTNVNNPMYEDIELVGLTKASLSTENMISIDNVKYDVMYITPSKRFNEVFLRKTSR